MRKLLSAFAAAALAFGGVLLVPFAANATTGEEPTLGTTLEEMKEQGLIPADFETPVLDGADLFSDQREADLTNGMVALHNLYDIVFVVETVASLEGQEIESFAQSRFQQLGIGDKEKNNGVFVLVAPNERKVRFHTGLGVEAKVSNSDVDRIIDSRVVPPIRDSRDYYKGITAGMDAIAAVYSTGSMPSNGGYTGASFDSEAFAGVMKDVGITVGGVAVLAIGGFTTASVVRARRERREEEFKARVHAMWDGFTASEKKRFEDAENGNARFEIVRYSREFANDTREQQEEALQQLNAHYFQELIDPHRSITKMKVEREERLAREAAERAERAAQKSAAQEFFTGMSEEDRQGFLNADSRDARYSYFRDPYYTYGGRRWERDHLYGYMFAYGMLGHGVRDNNNSVVRQREQIRIAEEKAEQKRQEEQRRAEERARAARAQQQSSSSYSSFSSSSFGGGSSGGGGGTGSW